MVATKEETAKALACLCCLKPELVLTEAQVTAWHAALCGYKPKTLNYAAIEVGAMPMAYPSLADLLTRMTDLATTTWLVLATLEWVFWGAILVTVGLDHHEEGFGVDVRKEMREFFTKDPGPVVLKILGAVVGVLGVALVV